VRRREWQEDARPEARDRAHSYWKKLLGEELYAKYAFEKLYPASTERDAYRQHLKAQADLRRTSQRAIPRLPDDVLWRERVTARDQATRRRLGQLLVIKGNASGF